MALGFYWLSKSAEKSKSDRISIMSHGYKYSKGIIEEKHSYKGQTVTVRCQIDGVYYDCIRNWDTNPRNIGVGDSISFKYATNNHKVIITELEYRY
jgi:hypothetical protein